MSDPISSSGWTGPPESMSAPHRSSAFIHRYGQHQVTSDYARLAAAHAEAERIASWTPPELEGPRRLAASLFISPVVLWLAHMGVSSSTRDLIVQDNAYILILVGLAAMGLAVLLFAIRSVALLWLRKAFTLLSILAVFVCTGVYVYVAIKAHGSAVTLAPERAFIFSNKDSVNFERKDGSLVLGSGRQQPREHGSCVSVTLLRGDYGFTWARVVEWVPRERHQLFWPIRREDCFSDKPLASFAS